MPQVHETRNVPFQLHDTFDYCLSALNSCGFEIVNYDKNAGIILSGVPQSAAGNEMRIRIVVMPCGDNDSSVEFYGEQDWAIYGNKRCAGFANEFWQGFEFIRTRMEGQRQTVAVEVVNKVQSEDVSAELRELTNLHHEGILSVDEWQRAKEGLVGKPSNQVDEATRLLRQLGELAAQGVLTEAEFNMKKCDILSERLLSRDRPARQTPPTQQAPSACPPLFAVAPDIPLEDAVACPICSDPIDERTLVIGNNTCPHCRGVFEAE